jgi:hypothetical protein
MFEIASPRMKFSSEENQQFERLSLGYKGEKLFAELLQENLHQHHIPLFGIQLNVSGSECQLDCMLIFGHGIYLFEIKYHQGDYYVEGDQWFSHATGKEVRNPVFQLRRSNLLLQDFLSKKHAHFSIESHLVYNHPNFYLYQAARKIPIIFSGQQHRFIQKLNRIPSQLHEAHDQLAEKLKEAHITDSKFEEIPTFEYKRLRKGVVCKICGSFMRKASQRQFICPHCNADESVEKALIRMIKEFHFLFPEIPPMTDTIMEWTNNTISESTVYRYLKKCFP